MADITVHIGTPKTGTTYLQWFCKSNAKRLADLGWHYPVVRSRPNHIALGAPFWDGRSTTTKFMGLDTPEAKLAMREEAGDYFSQKLEPGQHWLLSSESYWHRMNSADQIAAFIAFLRDYFSDVTVLVYFRRQDYYLPSIYSQRVKATGVTPEWTWDDFCARLAPSLNHLESLETWAGIPGVDRVVARPYLESYKNDSSALQTDFLTAVGIPAAGPWLPAAGPSNPSLSAEGVAFMRIVEKYIPVMMADGTSNRALRRQIYATLRTLTDPAPVQLTRAMFAEISQYFEASNAALVERCGSSPEWQQWLSQDPPRFSPDGADSLQITARRVADLIVGLSTPHGPVDWGQPNGVPRRNLLTLRQRIQRRRQRKSAS